MLRINEIITLLKASTAMTEMPITMAGSRLTVTASVEQMPKICTSTGLSFDSGLKSASLFFLFNIVFTLYSVTLCSFLKNGS